MFYAIATKRRAYFLCWKELVDRPRSCLHEMNAFRGGRTLDRTEISCDVTSYSAPDVLNERSTVD